MKAELRQAAIELRVKKRLSYGEIRKKLGVSRGTLSYWLREHPLKKDEIAKSRYRSWLKGAASRELFRISMQKKREQLDKEIYNQQKIKLVNTQKESFFVAGLMLYLGEGDKKNRARVGLANSDPLVIKFFVKWLKDFLFIRKEKIHIELHLYENMDIQKEEKFWSHISGISKEQFYKIQIRKLKKGSFTYQESQRHGTCSVIVNSTEKKREVMTGIRAFVDLYQKKRV